MFGWILWIAFYLGFVVLGCLRLRAIFAFYFGCFCWYLVLLFVLLLVVRCAAAWVFVLIIMLVVWLLGVDLLVFWWICLFDLMGFGFGWVSWGLLVMYLFMFFVLTCKLFLVDWLGVDCGFTMGCWFCVLLCLSCLGTCFDCLGIGFIVAWCSVGF